MTDTRPEIPVCALPAGVIGLDADCIVVSDMGPVLDDYDKVFARRQAVATGEAHTEPHRIAECRGCIWWPHCEAELLDRRDVSLVVRGAADALLGVGIATVDQLARYTGNRRSTGRRIVRRRRGHRGGVARRRSADPAGPHPENPPRRHRGGRRLRRASVKAAPTCGAPC